MEKETPLYNFISKNLKKIVESLIYMVVGKK